jgi:hypothetical protein
VVVLQAYPQATAATISCGQTVTGSITAAGQTDSYTFTASAGDTVVISTQAGSGSLAATADLYGPSGQSVASTARNSTTGVVSLAASGTYTILVRDYYLSYTGNYGVSLQFANGCGGPPGPGNPMPSITILSPNGMLAGSPAFDLTVSGFEFVVGSTVRWNNQDRSTTFLSSVQLRAVIPAADLAAAGTASVTVFNPGPGGGISNSLTFTIRTNKAASTALYYPRLVTTARRQPGLLLPT